MPRKKKEDEATATEETATEETAGTVVAEAEDAGEEDATEIVEPSEDELITVSGSTFDAFTTTASSFVPALKEDMPLEERKNAIRELLRQTAAVGDRLQLVQGELLYEVRRNNYWKEWSFVDESAEDRTYDSFDEYVKTEMDMERRKAYYLIDVYETFVVKLSLPHEVLQDLEWSKAKELTKVITEENAEELLDKIGSLSVRKTIDYVKELKDRKALPSGKSLPEPKKSLAFRLTADQLENVDQSLAGASQHLSTEIQEGPNATKNAAALDLICSEYNAGLMGSGEEGIFTKLETVVKHIERSFGVKLEVSGVTDDRYGTEDSKEE